MAAAEPAALMISGGRQHHWPVQRAVSEDRSRQPAVDAKDVYSAVPAVVDRVDESIYAPLSVLSDMQLSNLFRHDDVTCAGPPRHPNKAGSRSTTPTGQPLQPPPYHVAMRRQVESSSSVSSVYSTETYAEIPRDYISWRHAVRRSGGASSQSPLPKPPLPRSSSTCSSPASSVHTIQGAPAAAPIPIPVTRLTPPLYRQTSAQPSTGNKNRNSMGFVGSRGLSPMRQMSHPGNSTGGLKRSALSNDCITTLQQTNGYHQEFEPPRLAQSGILGKSAGKVVLRPFVFKPVQNGGDSADSGFIEPACSVAGGSSERHQLVVPKTAGSVENKPYNSPSPADSGVAVVDSVEHLLRQREAELVALRGTMEQNEAAMLRVFEERRRDLEKQLQKERQRADKLDSAMNAASRRARQAEAAATESRSLLQERSQELGTVRSQLRLAQSSSEERGIRCNELETSLSEASSALETATCELRDMKSCDRLRSTGCQTVACDGADTSLLQERLALQEAQFEEVRAQWLDEKSKVIAYQKQLQLNYLQLCKKSQRLESEVQHLTLDLERKDLKMQNGSGPGSHAHSNDSSC